ncbi:hypothetical protein [Thiothrix nivea]|uniref:Uncharacterized protein n=1 Tax=Thiothrix nivea (strain ATCC 35100 / DSM 5205 / JP2) TaxID=870187 RepID=A0A656HAK2_THINJ|nr:hypothetical protein [Thiothrix nivea]EIJ33317.1 hypothetical protein Thini_0680 [Thiothrix nivea DSM 5205]
MAMALRGDLSVANLLAYVPLVVKRHRFPEVWARMGHFLDGFQAGAPK